MGDTGSLFLGGAVCGLAFALDVPLVIPLVGLIYVLETLSDIIQVIYFKATHGKRFFPDGAPSSPPGAGGLERDQAVLRFLRRHPGPLRAGLPGRHEPISHVTGGAERFSSGGSLSQYLRTGGGPRGPKTKSATSRWRNSWPGGRWICPFSC